MLISRLKGKESLRSMSSVYRNLCNKGFVTNQQNEQLEVFFLAQLAEHCTSIANVIVLISVQA